MEPLVLLLFVLVLVVLAWKFLGGALKTVALVALLLAAAVYVFGVMN